MQELPPDNAAGFFLQDVILQPHRFEIGCSNLDERDKFARELSETTVYVK